VKHLSESVSLRPAGEKDLTALADLWSRLQEFHYGLGMTFPMPKEASQKWVDSFRRTLGRFSFAWIAESNGSPKGFLLARVKQSPAFLGGVQVGEISDLYVSDDSRDAGIGSKLVEVALQKFKELGMHSVEAQVLSGNDEGLSFWLKSGFKQDLTLVRKNFGDRT
jgi:ribosomal protein S18 acetylase RimI-like enzyme